VATTPDVSRALYNLAVDERRAEIGGIEIFWREAAPTDGGAPVVYVHGVPTSSDDWLPFLERTGGFALDLPGFGRSGKPSDFPYSIEGYAGFLDAWLSEAGVDRYRLVVHDWGAVGLALAELAPERVERLVVINAVPLLAGYRWHRFARLWRTPGVGEVVIGLTTGFAARRLLPRGVGEIAAAHLDQGTQRAILRLYRSAPPDVLARHEPALSALADVPTLVLWGEEDPYIPAKFAGRYADALGGADVRVLAGAGHWPWIGDDAVADAVAEFLR
jgi:pimeloyl-ACP methyl ester carboxylesterase